MSVRIKWNLGGFDALRTSSGVVAMVEAEAKRIADACNATSVWGGYHYEMANTAKRARARVWSSDRRNDEARDNRLIRAM